MLFSSLSRSALLVSLSLLFIPLGASAQAPANSLRVATWNVTNFDTDTNSANRKNSFETAIYGKFSNGTTYQQSMAPDILVGQEFISQASVNNFVSLLNEGYRNATGLTGDWTSAPFLNGPDTDSALFYRTSKASFLQTVTVNPTAGGANEQPRNTYRYDVSLSGINGGNMSIYSVHMKSGSTDSDQARRLIEAQRIRDNAQTLGATPFMMVGDTNFQSSSQAAYQKLVGSETNNQGRFFDPIATPGNWNNTSAFRYVHTQDPNSAMDDRLDFMLLSNGLLDGSGLDYAKRDGGVLGNSTTPYSTTTWNDPNHSYRSWGNDGTSFNQQLTTTGNAMVGSSIATALVATANDGGANGGSGGHLPVFLDLTISPVPAPPGMVSLLIGGVVTLGGAVRRRRQSQSIDSE